MNKGVVFVEHFFYSTMWIFIMLISGVFFLSWLKMRGGAVGHYADWTISHAGLTADQL